MLEALGLNRSRGSGGERAERAGVSGQRQSSALSQDRGVPPHARQELSMSKKPVSPLRQRLIDDITARRFSEDTKRDYVRNVRKFAAFLGRLPDTATSDDLRRYQ